MRNETSTLSIRRATVSTSVRTGVRAGTIHSIGSAVTRG